MHCNILHPRPEVDPSYMPTEEVWPNERGEAFASRRDSLFQQLQAVVEIWQEHEPRIDRVVIRQVVGQVAAVMAAEAASADLVVLGTAGPADDLDSKQAIEAVLFHGRAPIILVPAIVPISLGQRIAVAWERSQAVKKAVDAARPLLMVADRVTILVAGEGDERASLPRGLLQALQQQGVATQIHRFDLHGREIGPALLEEARTAKADLLVMGAFTHNRTLEAFFGGATAQVLASADLPLLMHH